MGLKTALIAAALLCGNVAFAQTVMDGSDTNLSPREKTILYDVFRTSLLDPFGSQVIDLKQASEDRICGQINAKNRMGGFAGFRPFVLNVQDRELVTLPDLGNFDVTHPEAAQRLAQAKLAIAAVRDACHSGQIEPTTPQATTKGDQFP